MPSVAFWPGVAGGTRQYRCDNPGEALRRAGWDVSYVEDETASLDVDVLVFQRCVGDWMPELIRRLRKVKPTTIVYDIDDDYDAIPAYNYASTKITPDVLATVHEAMELADLITVSTPALAEVYKRFGKVEVLPNYLDPITFAEVEKFRSWHDGIWIGWLNAFQWRGGDAELLKPWLPQFLEDHPEVTFVSCGGPEVIEYLGIKGLTSPTIPGRVGYLRPYDHLPAMLAPLDIGLCPVTFNRFNEAKSWCKAMEYGISSVPAVASASREYRSYIRPGVNGLLVRKNNWVQQIESVIDDLDNYRLGARKVAEEHFIDDHVGRWEAAYRACRHL